MRSKRLTCIQATVLLAVLAIPVSLAAQQQNAQHHHYKLIDLGTFGGPQSWVFGAQEIPGAVLSNSGIVGGADTSNSNPEYPNINPFLGPAGLFGYADPFIFQAFQWNNGAVINLGTLPGGNDSFANWISSNGIVGGASENGEMDPLLGVPEVHAVIWSKDNHGIIDLGTLPGGYESDANAVNNRGEAAVGALDAAGNTRAVLWSTRQGLQDLGTLGSSGALATLINDRGQVTGVSALCDTCNQDAFFWENGNMQRIPDFGGPISFPNAINNRGQVIGQSDLPGGATAHAFLWDKGVLIDLGTLPGNSGSGARWINEGGDIVGESQNGLIYHAVLWKHRQIIDLGTIDPCSIAESINSQDQIVGESENCDGIPLHAFLWEDGGPIVDLNTVIPPDSGLTLTLAVSVNDRGEIAGQATTSTGDNHAVLLIPCDENHSGVDGCNYSSVYASAAEPEHTVLGDGPVRRPSALPRQGHRFHPPGFAAGRVFNRKGTLTRNTSSGETAGSPGTSQLHDERDILRDDICIFHCVMQGNCFVVNGKLDGLCGGTSIHETCTSKPAPTQCPTGQRPKRGGYANCGIREVVEFDFGRTCTD